MSRANWKIMWPALRGLGYQKAREFYGIRNLETPWICWLAREQAKGNPYPWNPLCDRLRAFKLGTRTIRLKSFNPPLPLP
jgi:hypothetical protein